MNNIYYTIYQLIGNALYGTLPEAGTATELSLTLLSTALSFFVVLLPLVVCFWGLKTLFRMFSWG